MRTRIDWKYALSLELIPFFKNNDRLDERETLALIEKVRGQASLITEPDDVWRLHDFLSTRRHEIYGK